VITRKGNQFIAKEDSVCIVMYVEIVDGKVIQSSETLVSEDNSWEGIEFSKMMFRMITIVGLQ
jgi:hypothetical protein